MNPAIVAGVALVVGLGLGWVGGSTMGGGGASAEGGAGSGSGGSPGSGSYAGMNSGTATADGAAGGGAGAGAPEQVATADSNVFTAQADTVFKKLLEELESGEQMDPMTMLARLQQLKDMGDEGVRVMAAYLKSNEDIDLAGGRMGRGATTLRMALLNTLNGMETEAAKDASLYVMQSSPYISEVAMAARNLEGSWPGEYTEQVNQQMKSLINGLADAKDLSEDEMRREGFMAMNYITRNNAADLLPTMEKLVASGDNRAFGFYLGQLENMAPAAQSEALARMASDPLMRPKLLANGDDVAELDMSSPATQKEVGILLNEMPPDQQEEFLEELRGGNRGRGRGNWGRGGGQETPPEQQIASAEGSVAVLNAYTPTTPVQQQLRNEALDRLNRRIEQLKTPPTQ